MPSSSIATMPPVIRTVIALQPTTVLDLGMGTGKYGLMLREQVDWAVGGRTLRITGVEGWADYVGDHQRLAYDEIVVADIRDYLADTNGARFDVAMLNDVLEHFDPAEAVTVARRALEIAGTLVVSTPAEFYEQKIGVEYEWHRSWWPAKKLRELGDRLGARSDVCKVEHTMFAAYSRASQPRIVRDPVPRIVARALRDRVVPSRGGGPTI